jgi:hypothetical protein
VSDSSLHLGNPLSESTWRPNIVSSWDVQSSTEKQRSENLWSAISLENGEYILSRCMGSCAIPLSIVKRSISDKPKFSAIQGK